MVKKIKKKVHNPVEELATILDTLRKSIDAKTKAIKAIKIRKVKKDERRHGLLDSGATNSVREMKKNESMKGLIPIEVEVAFESEVKAELYINRFGKIVGPEGTETIVALSEAIEAGYEVAWKTKRRMCNHKGWSKTTSRSTEWNSSLTKRNVLEAD